MIPKSDCPFCGMTLWDDKPSFTPKAGMLAICIFCGEVIMLDKKLRLRKPDYVPDDIKIRSDVAKFAIDVGFDFQKFVKDFKTH